ncbi:hypothetical protein DFJ77DRAFT_549251 [Powellomyces hirtus]|nr:hypothetical protein DFJ77DRAFT_549251 [Powellomyces hirtus]
MASSKARRSSPYDDDPMVRLTGLSLDPDFPPHQHHAAPSQATPGSPLPAAPATITKDPKDTEASTHPAGAVPPPIDTDRSASPRNADYDDAADGAVSAGPHSAGPDGAHQLTVRALVTTREAGVIIGKGGKNVAEIRDVTNVKAGVSKVVQGVHERVLTVSGTVDSLAKAFYFVAKHLLDNPVESPRQREPVQPDCTTVRLLVAHQLMGSIIGKGGSRIRDIQEESGAKITVSKDMLPQSTERVIEIYGLADSIQIAVYQICECILNDIGRVTGTILYSPENRNARSPRGDRYGGDYEHSPRSAGPERRGGRRASFGEGSTPRRTGRVGSAGGAIPLTPTTPNTSSNTNNGHFTANDATTGDQRVQTLAIPVEMVGSIIGRGGSFINQIRKASGARLRIDELQDGQSSRTVTITGTDAATKTALEMIYNQLETEKQRRIASHDDHQDGGAEADHNDY